MKLNHWIDLKSEVHIVFSAGLWEHLGIFVHKMYKAMHKSQSFVSMAKNKSANQTHFEELHFHFVSYYHTKGRVYMTY